MVRYVYRMQNAKGEGPYWRKSDIGWQEVSHDYSPRTPPAWEDDDDYHGEKVFFSVYDVPMKYRDGIYGFKNRKQAEEWFTEREIARLRLRGFRLVRVRAMDVIEFGHQVIFKRAV